MQHPYNSLTSFILYCLLFKILTTVFYHNQDIFVDTIDVDEDMKIKIINNRIP